MRNHRFSGHRATALALVVLVGAAGGTTVGLQITSAAAPRHPAAVLTASHSTRAANPAKTVTLPQCGATRDPFDPTNSSGAAC